MRPTARFAPTLLAVTVVVFTHVAALAHAQDGRIDLVTGDEVVFVVTPDDLAAAVACPGCDHVAAEPGTPIALRVLRQNPNRLYTVEVFEAGWNPPSTLDIEARHTVTSVDGQEVFFVTDWRSLGGMPSLVLRQSDVGRAPQVRIEVSYRLRLRGDEPAGTFLGSVAHRVRESGSVATHGVRVTVPAFLVLRLVPRDGSVAPAYDVSFDYGSRPATFLQALATGTTLPPTGGDLARVEISTNHASGFTVTLAVEEVEAPGGTAATERLRLQGQPVNGRTFRRDAPTNGFETLLLADDFAFDPSDSTAGRYRLLVTYQAAPNP